MVLLPLFMLSFVMFELLSEKLTPQYVSAYMQFLRLKTRVWGLQGNSVGKGYLKALENLNLSLISKVEREN